MADVSTRVEKRETIPQIIRSNYVRWGRRTAMCMKMFGVWHRYSWQDYYENVKYFSLGLVSLGLARNDVVCIIGDNEPQWFWGEFAVQAAGGIATGVFVDSIPSEVKYIAEHSDSKFAIVNDQEQTDKLLEIKDGLPLLKKVIYWDPKGLRNYDDPALISFDEVIALGREYEKTHPGAFEETVESGRGDDIAFIYYTSGTTGLPKGAILTHRALITTARGFVNRYPMDEHDDLLSNFPAAWVGDSFFATIPHLLTGAKLNFPEEPETVAEDTREVGPNFVIYGPRQWEGLVSEIQVKMVDANPLKRFTYNLFLPVGHKIADMKFDGKTPGLFWKILHGIAYLALFRPLKDRLGLSKVRFAVTGSSVLSLDTFRLIHAIGVELRQCYASTEAGLISSHGKGEIKFESVGRPALGTELRITDKGELLVSSDCMFRGYHKDPEKTAITLIDGWCHTGDAVNIDEEGHLIFMDRLEHMGELSTGAKYAPQYIEGRLRFSPYIKDAMVIGGKDKDFVSAIINIDFAMVGKWAERHRIPYTTFVDLSQKKEVADLVRQDLERVNGYLPEQSRVRKFVLLHKEFDPDEAELTRTRKLRREFMETRYRDLIGAMYGNRDKVDVQAPVTYRDGRKGVVTTGIQVRSL
ncbi:MAG TPA: AMP-binding protein [Dehalococcoidales bacterium]|nr:MAG: AMP-binding protein [Chloroflexi bacterium RBG_16_60_22]HJX13473.1 AMP-binding protein [Dehalococcoidales bacterium]